ncbi:MAG TPA: DUF4340 domain-containing protein [Anaerolineae bacterium]|nr:DUF4340 domain-containing protein [Anaerolineae bacterium]
MKPRTTLLVVGVFLALLAYVYLGELRRPAATDTATTPTPAPLLSVAADQVLGLSVSGGGKETRLARQVGREWQLEAPVPGPADASRVSQFLGRVAMLNPTRSLDDAGPLEEYGLAPPALEVTLTLADGSTQVLRIGAENPQQTAYYAQVQGQAGVHLVAALTVQSAQGMLDTPPVPPTATPAATSTPTEASTPAS